MAKDKDKSTDTKTPDALEHSLQNAIKMLVGSRAIAIKIGPHKTDEDKMTFEIAFDIGIVLSISNLPQGLDLIMHTLQESTQHNVIN